jgi:hypothetical protein
VSLVSRLLAFGRRLRRGSYAAPQSPPAVEAETAGNGHVDQDRARPNRSGDRYVLALPQEAASGAGPRFFGPPLRLCVVRNSDWALRYPFTDSQPLVDSLVDQWGGCMQVSVYDEDTSDLADALARALGRTDALVLLSGALRPSQSLNALTSIRDDLESWVHAGGGLFVLDPGGGLSGEWLGDSLRCCWQGLPDDWSHDAIAVYPHAVTREPFPVAGWSIPRIPPEDRGAFDTRLGEQWLEDASVVVRTDSCDYPLLAVKTVGRGRVAFTSMHLDWLNAGSATINVLTWLTGCRVARIGEHREAFGALAQQPAVNRRVAVIEGESNSAAPGAGKVVRISSPAGQQYRLELPTWEGEAIDVLYGRMYRTPSEDRGSDQGAVWDGSGRRTLEVTRFLAAADALGSQFDDALTYTARGFKLHEKGWGTGSGVHMFALARLVPERLPLTIRDDLYMKGWNEFCTLRPNPLRCIREFPLYALGLGAHDLDRAQGALSCLRAALASPDASHANALDRLAATGAAMWLTGDSAAWQPESTDLAEVLRKPPPAAVLFDVLAVDAAMAAGGATAMTPEDRLALAASLAAELSSITSVSSVGLARHLAFWREHPELHDEVLTLVAAMNAVDGVSAWSRDAPSAGSLTQDRLRECYAMLRVPPEERRSNVPVPDLLEQSAARTVRAGLAIAMLPMRRFHRVAEAITRPTLTAGGVGLAPLLAKDFFAVLTGLPTATRIIATTTFGLGAIGIAVWTRMPRAVMAFLAVVMTAWAGFVIVLASQFFASTDVKQMSWFDRLIELWPGVLTLATALMLIACITYWRTSETGADGPRR